MAVSYLRLFDPTQQFQLKNGALNVSGRLYVYLEGTDDYADLFDENGSQLQQPVVLDNNGRAAGLYVDSKKTYWMKVNDQYDSTLFTIRKMTPCGGGGGSVLSGQYDVISSDGSIVVDKSVDAGNTTYDLSIPSDSNDLLEWFRSDSYSVIPATTIYKPVCIKGTMSVGSVGVKLKANQYYHVTGHITAMKEIERVPYYDEIAVKYYLRGTDLLYDQLVMSSNQIVDYSLGMGQEFEISTDVMAPCDCELYVSVEGQSVFDGSFGLTNMEVHRVYSGCPSIPSGVLTKDEAAATYQPLLTAGDNIVIDPVTWTISATGGGGGGGGIVYTSGNGIFVHNTGNHEIDADFDVIQHKLVAGDGITIDPSTWVISSSNGGGQYTGDNHVLVNNITKVISLDDEVVVDPDYVHTENNFTNVYKNKLDGIQAGAEQNVQSDWLETDSDDDSFIRHKPSELASSLDSGTELIEGSGISLTPTSAGLVISSTASGGSAPWTYFEDTTFDITVTATDVVSGFFERVVPITDQTIVDSGKDFLMVYQCQVEADSTNPPSIPDMTPIKVNVYDNQSYLIDEITGIYTNLGGAALPMFASHGSVRISHQMLATGRLFTVFFPSNVLTVGDKFKLTVRAVYIELTGAN